MPSSLVQRVHFEDFGGHEFERLVFAYHVRAGWSDLAWYGQVGSDDGRDIVGRQPLDDGSFRTAIIQCVNRGALTQKKADEDMVRAVTANATRPIGFKFVARGTISAARRDGIEATARTLGVASVTTWSGVDFEEHLRLIGEDLLRRFCDGEAFPDEPEKLRQFAADFPSLSDHDALEQMAAVFQRPAFQTRLERESSLPTFLTAIEDTMAAINTGIWRTCEGDVTRRIPSVHHLRDPRAKSNVMRAAQIVDKLRQTFVAGLRDKSIRPCGCSDPSCPTFMLSDGGIAGRLDQLRREALDAFRAAHPSFDVRLN